ncbi:MAG: TIGR01906 family membrane protein [Eubacteriales bacterium]
MLKKMLMLILIIVIPFLVLLTSTQIMVQWDSFYRYEYNQNNVVVNTGIEMEELMYVTDEIQKYLFSQRDDFAIMGTVESENRQIFNEREITHMDDVKELFVKGMYLRNIGVLLGLLLVILLFRMDKRALYKSLRISTFVFFAFSSVMGMLFAFDFTKYFILFHELFFRNDYWVLDPTDSILINMVPLNFFIHIAVGIIVFSIFIMLCIGLLGYKLGKIKGGRHIEG